MIFIKNFEQFSNRIDEYNKFDVDTISNRSNDLNIGIEIELEYVGDDLKPSEDDDENLTNIEQIFKYAFQKFTRTYSNVTKVVSDSTLVNGMEIVSQPFNNSNDATNYITSFFEDYNIQDFFRFEKTTGIHINISLKSKDSINYLKLFLFLNDTINKKAGYIYKDFEDRFQNKWTRPVKSVILNKIKNSIPYISKMEILNDEFIISTNKMIKDNFFKNKVVKKSYSIVVKDNYFEFRHIGGSDISLEKVLAKMNYFSYLSTLAFDKEYKRKDYLKKLYIFVYSIL